VRQIYSGDDLVGHYDREWDGTDDSGSSVSPGIYLYRIVAGTDRSDEVRLGVINVAY
jgi:flagellar hook assembly protein FlgD